MAQPEDEWFAREQPQKAVAADEVDLPYSERGGVSVKGTTVLSGYSATWPFATILVERGKVTVSCFRDSFVFRPSSSTRVGSQRGFMSTGIRLESDDGSEPLTVTFWSNHYSRLQSATKMAGF